MIGLSITDQPHLYSLKYDGNPVGIENFSEVFFSSGGKQRRIKRKQDKGYKNEIGAFFDAIRTGGASPIPFAKIVETTLATFAINESINTGQTITFPEFV